MSDRGNSKRYKDNRPIKLRLVYNYDEKLLIRSIDRQIAQNRFIKSKCHYEKSYLINRMTAIVFG